VGLARPTVQTATIANAASLSDAVDVGEGVVVGFLVPTFTSAALTFQGSDDGITFKDLKDAAAAEVTIVASVGDVFFAAPAALNSAAFIKVRSGTSAAPVAQGAQRLIKVVIK
jgi:hypothetical protein